MKSLPIALDRLLANPSYERVEGKLLKAAEDGSRVILELKGKKLRTLMGPLGEAQWAALVDKQVVAFVKAGEPTRVFEAKLIPRELKSRPATVKGDAPKRATSAAKKETKYSVPVKWRKYAEGRMIGEPVKLANMEKGFDLDAETLHRIFNYLGVNYLPITKSIAYLDFRKVFLFMCEPAFKAFLQGEVLPPPVKPVVAEEDDEDEDEVEEEVQEVEGEEEPAKPAGGPAIDRNFRSNLSKYKKPASADE